MELSIRKILPIRLGFTSSWVSPQHSSCWVESLQGESTDNLFVAPGDLLALYYTAIVIDKHADIDAPTRSLTLALMGSDDMHLRVLAQSSSDPAEKKHASKVLKLLQRGRHWVLVVLLLSNVVSPHHGDHLCASPGLGLQGSTFVPDQIVNESLPIFLDSVLGGGIAAVLVSTASATRP